jgi:NAD(P)-dependent dehydrogenase (short-subunit alcohol dehydrogenase family)
VPTDVTDEASVQDAVAQAVARGPLRVAVNCAGIGTPGRVVGKNGPLPLEAFAPRRHREPGRHVQRRAPGRGRDGQTDPVDGERGVIVNTASAAAFDGQIGQAAYSASKGGVVGMTLPLARDLADKLVRVMTVAPGLFDTPMLQGLPEPARQSLGAQVPMPSRLGTRASTRCSSGTSARTRCSTARSSASTAPSGWRPARSLSASIFMLSTGC